MKATQGVAYAPPHWNLKKNLIIASQGEAYASPLRTQKDQWRLHEVWHMPHPIKTKNVKKKLITP